MAFSYTPTSNFKMIDNYIYFYHLDKFCVLPTYPDSITDNIQTTFYSTNALSRSAPVFSFINSGPRTMSISLDLHRDMMNDLNRTVSNLKDNVVDFSGNDYVDTLIKYLQAAALPKYQTYSSGSKSVIPPMVAIRFGSEIFIKGVITSGVQTTFKRPILYNDKYALVTISFTISETEPFDADSVAAEGSFRGITSAFRDGIYNSTDSDNMSGSDIDITNWVVSDDASNTLKDKPQRKTNDNVTDSKKDTRQTEKTTPKVDEPNPNSMLPTYCWQYGDTGPYSRINTQVNNPVTPNTNSWASGGQTNPYYNKTDSSSGSTSGSWSSGGQTNPYNK